MKPGEEGDGARQKTGDEDAAGENEGAELAQKSEHVSAPRLTILIGLRRIDDHPMFLVLVLLPLLLSQSSGRPSLHALLGLRKLPRFDPRVYDVSCDQKRSGGRERKSQFLISDIKATMQTTNPARRIQPARINSGTDGERLT
ncbi:hypothetical protein [Cohnella hashimotonis]|uniref:Uncharacterized protein n=1 Tax=Cohnella hashimotonis TaxID=2826895 RepID=A0ABT6TBZ4_9BACL|nr:hypothetical protein [Cohnella hashimotonis]MDI4644340.1 hypothetical protein [Cohnella hashimotonis]